MNSQDLYSYYGSTKEHGILLAFSGLVSQELMVEYGKLLNERVETQPNNRILLFSVFIELTQNILRYSAEREVSEGRERGVGIVVVRQSNHAFYVSAGNLISPEQEDSLRQHLDLLLSLDKAGLKELHKERRRMDPPESSKGAGLGLIEVARRASQPIEYDIQPYDGGGFFSISVQTPRDASL